MNAMPKPKLTEARLRHMQARASRVWKGESQPQVAMAEDILLLIGEVNDLRAKVAAHDQHTLFPESESLFTEFNSFFRDSNKNVPKQDQGPSVSRHKAFMNWFNSLWGRL